EVGAERAARRLETGGHAAAEDTLHGHESRARGELVALERLQAGDHDLRRVTRLAPETGSGAGTMLRAGARRSLLDAALEQLLHGPRAEQRREGPGQLQEPARGRGRRRVHLDVRNAGRVVRGGHVAPGDRDGGDGTSPEVD